MKFLQHTSKLIFITCLQVIFFVTGYAQVIPKGMNYQAVARNHRGDIFPNQKINLKIYLFSQQGNNRTNHYSELHESTTNDLGYFNLIIGEGVKSEGEYGMIPWNTENIWLEVAMRDKSNQKFSTVSSSKLLAVPYSFHAGTADKLSNTVNKQVINAVLEGPGVISNFWSVFGNAMTDASGNLYHTNSLGTTDKVDLIMITDNVERLRILKGGDIFTKLNFEVGRDLKVGQNLYVVSSATIGDTLTVKKNVLLNASSGSTINYGPFTVTQQSPSLLSGLLTVNGPTDLNSAMNVHGPTDLNDSLTVTGKSPVKLTGSLQVDSTSNLLDSLNVLKQSQTMLSGTLTVDSCAVFKDKVKIVSSFSTDTSGISPSGSLQVNGGTFVKENLYIGGIAKFGGPVGFERNVLISGTTQSNDPKSGVLKVSGGVGIGKNLNVGGFVMIDSMTTVKDLTESIDSTTGALKVLGGVGVKLNLNTGGSASIGNTLRVKGITEINDSLTVINAQPYIANFRNKTNRNGISIQVNNGVPGWENNFMEFRGNGIPQVVGRIEGENENQYQLNETWKRQDSKLFIGILATGIGDALAIIKTVVAGIELTAAITSATFCAGFGIMVCAPIPSLIIKAGLDVVAGAVLIVANTAAVIVAADRYQDFKDYTKAHVGVTYESGAGDYAEWLPKSDVNETFFPAQIVGLKNGAISKNLDGANKLMVISTQPAVLGNMPSNKEMPYEKVAFLGQVPVHVMGKVNVGDFIVPSGKDDGLGKAISPDKMMVEDYQSIVGVAWSASDDKRYSPVNVAIGLNGNEVNKVVIEQKKRILELKSNYEKRNEILSGLVPGFKDKLQITSNQNSAMENRQSLFDTNKKGAEKNPSTANRVDLSQFKISQDQISSLLSNAEKKVIESGVNVETHEFWKRIRTEPGFKNSLVLELQNRVNSEIDKYNKENGTLPNKN